MQQYYLDFYIKNQSDSIKYISSTLSGVHHYLRNKRLDNIGLSFPEYGQSHVDGLPMVGQTIRLVCDSEVTLFEIRGAEWFTTHILNGDLAVSKIQPVPESAKPVFFVRSRRPETLTRRMKELFPGQRITPYSVNKAGNNPLAMVKFYTIEKPIHMFVELRPAQSHQAGSFNSYGLCTNENLVSVPWF